MKRNPVANSRITLRSPGDDPRRGKNKVAMNMAIHPPAATKKPMCVAVAAINNPRVSAQRQMPMQAANR